MTPLILFLSLSIIFADPTIQPDSLYGYVASARTIAALDYHGIGYAKCDEKGVLWFKRKGKRCRVFNKKFEISWNKRR